MILYKSKEKKRVGRRAYILNLLTGEIERTNTYMKNTNNKQNVSIPITIIANIDLNVKYGDKTPEQTRKNNTLKWSEKKIKNLKNSSL